MIVEYIRYTIDEARHSAFVDAYKQAALQLDISVYCKGYELTQCEEDADQFILRIVWTSTEDHINGFRKSAAFRDFFTAIKPYVNDIKEMRHYKVTEVVSNK